MLSLDPAAERIGIVELEDAGFDPFAPDRPLSDLGLDTPSLLGAMYYLAQAVEAPPEHVERGLVTRTVDQAGRTFDWSVLLGDLFRVASSRDRPQEAAGAAVCGSTSTTPMKRRSPRCCS